MPNWNNNTITITGPTDKISALWAAAQPVEGKDGSLLEAMVPIGEWDYDRAVAAWGTKWDLNLEGLEFNDLGDGTAQITGWADSAWSPPIEAFQTYSKANEDVSLEIKYFEPGMSFIGVWDNQDNDESWEDVGSLLNTTKEDDPVLYELLEHFDVWSWYDDEDEETEAVTEESEESEE
jgi:hypothetical protein